MGHLASLLNDLIIIILGSGLGLSRCLGPGECLHSFIHSIIIIIIIIMNS